MSTQIRPGTAPDRRWPTALAKAALLLLTWPSMVLLPALPSAAATAIAAPAEPRPQWGETLLLALKINGVPQDAMLRAVRLSEGLAVPQSSWDELRLRLPPTGRPRMIDGELHVLIENGGPLRWRIDEATQTLEIEAPASAFLAQQVDLAPGAPRVTQPSAWAPFLNYDAQWQSDRGSRDTGDVLWELGTFGPHGDFSSSGLARTEARGVRLDTRWQHDMPERLARLTVGDAINQAGAWGRAVRFGGLQWGTDFSLQPGFLSFPLPTLRGEAALPSTLDVYVNNGQRLQGRLQPGAFDLTDLPVVTGQGEIRTVVKDLLGREQVVVTPYYVSPALLKPGLRAGSIEVGTVREDYGIASSHYGRGLLTATERRGITDSFTAELRTELTRSQQALGISGWTLWPALGTASASAVASHSSTQGAGWMLAAGLDRQARDWSGSLQVRRLGPRFSQLGQADGTAPRLVVAAVFGTAWHGQSVGIGYTRQQGGAIETRLAQLNYGTALGRLGFLSLAVFRDFGPGGSGTSLSLSWSYALDERHSAGLSAQRQPDGRGGSRNQFQAQLQRNAGIGTGLGYQLLAETDGRQVAQASWQSEHAVLSGGVARRGADTEVRAGASGGLALLDGSVFTGRRIEGGIALVDVGGHAGVRVLQDNQVVAHTDAQGRAFVTGLRGYQTNRVGIDAADLPMDAELDALEIRLTPAARSAAYIEFPVRRGRSASLRVLDAAGRPLPPGTLLQPAGQPRSYPVGYDGRAYLAGLAEGRNLAAAAWPDGHCQLDFTLPPQGDDDDLPDLGALTCR